MENNDVKYLEAEVEKLSRALTKAESQADLYAKQLKALTNDGRSALTLCEVYKIMINLTQEDDMSDISKAKEFISPIKNSHLLDLSHTEIFVLARLYEKLQVISYHDEILIAEEQ